MRGSGSIGSGSNKFDGGFALALAAVVLAFWRLRIIAPATEVMFGASDDPYTQVYPMAHRAAEWIQAGLLPLWNPFQFCGHPFAATALYGVFYPLNFPFLVLPTEIAIEVIAVLHLILAGILLYGYGRTIALSHLASSAAAFTFILSGFMASQALWFTPAIGTAAWLPLGLIGVERTCTKPRAKGIGVVALAVGMPILAGWLQTWVYSMYALGGYAAARVIGEAWRTRDPRNVAKLALFLGAGMALGLALGAVQLLPSIELQSLGPRRPGGLSMTQIMPTGPLPPERVLHELVDSAPGFPRQAYVGIVSLLLSPIALLSRRRRLQVAFFWVMVLASLAVSVSVYTPVFALYGLLPGATWFRYPWRIEYLLSVGAAVLSGIGLDVLLGERKSRGADTTSRARTAMIVTIGVVVVVGVFAARAPAAGRTFLCLAVALAAIILAARGSARPLAAVGLVVLIVWDLFFATRSPALHPYHDLSVYDAEAEVLDYVKQRGGLYRTYIYMPSTRLPALMPKQGTLRGIYSLTDYEPLSLDRDAKFYRLLNHSGTVDYEKYPFIGLLDLDPSPAALRLADLMSLRFIVLHKITMPFRQALESQGWTAAFDAMHGQFMVYENPNPLPRAYVANDLLVAANAESAMQMLTQADFEARRSVVLEPGEGMALTPHASSHESSGTITPATIVVYEPMRVVINARSASDGYLVLTDTFYPGWKVAVDGQSQSIVRANALFRAVAIPAGEHTVTFVYDPLSFKLGAAMTLLALGVLAVAAVAAFRTRRVQVTRAEHEPVASPDATDDTDEIWGTIGNAIRRVAAARTAGPLGVALRIVLVLVVLDWWVAGPYFNHYIVPRYVSPFPLLRDRTNGQTLPILFDAIQRTSHDAERVAFVGDSTMNAADAPDQTVVPYLERQALSEARGVLIETIDASELGLFVGDAALFIDKLIGSDVEVIVYGLSLRAFPRAPHSRWVSRVSTELNVGDLYRLVAVRAGSWIDANLTLEQVMTGLVQSSWATYAYRASLRRDVWEYAIQPTVGPGTALARWLRPAEVEQQPLVAARTSVSGPYEWTAADYGFPNANWDALDVIGSLCHAYRPGRCVIYAGPVNPFGRDRLAEPGLYEEYIARLRGTADRYGLIWRDYSDAMTPADFRKPKYGGLRDPIHLNEDGRKKLAGLLAAPVADAVRYAADRVRQ
ncbi:MAG: YfhO family protein [Deltaproteobacteria bacterium]|nr:YfhO family protein [Deltaproteobacteria bacterium]MBI3391485.1 YfhO family protein [Deltaproteobacteria bacterium]